jgi:hypothetical protein
VTEKSQKTGYFRPVLERSQVPVFAFPGEKFRAAKRRRIAASKGVVDFAADAGFGVGFRWRTFV